MKAIWRPRFTNMGVRIILVLSIAISASPAAFGDEAWIQKELLAPQPMRAKKFWGPATEGLRAGVQVGYYSHKDFEYFSAGRDAIPIRLFPLMTYNGTNFGRLHSDFLDLDLPMQPCYNLELKQKVSGKIVPLTAAGRSLEQTEPKYYRVSANSRGVISDTGYRPNRLYLRDGAPSNVIQPLSLRDYFEITNTGNYTLTFKMCAFVPDGLSGKESLIWLPAVQCEVDISGDK